MPTRRTRGPLETALADPKQFLGVIQAGVALAVLFGVSLTAEQMSGIMAFLSALLIWLNSQQPTPQDVSELTKAAESVVRAKDLELNEVKKQAASVIEACES